MTARVCDALEAKPSRSERMLIKMFGSAHENRSVYNIVEVMLTVTDGEALILPMVVVLHICDPVRTQPVDLPKARYEHLSGLQLAVSCSVAGDSPIDLLIGSDHYWKIVTGTVLKGNGGPTAIETRLGWVLSGPAESLVENASLMFTIQSSRCGLSAKTPWIGD